MKKHTAKRHQTADNITSEPSPGDRVFIKAPCHAQQESDCGCSGTGCRLREHRNPQRGL